MVAVAIVQPLTFVLFALGMFLSTREMLPPVTDLLATATLVVSFVNYYLYAKSVSVAKKLNPEMRGDVFSPSFLKERLASGDEAQQKMIFEAGYRAYRGMSTVALILIGVSLVVMMLFRTSALPCVALSLVWLVGEWRFARTQYRQTRGE